ncbi:hypothetical protein DWX10_04650 [Clostridium sp. AF18-27]|nr:hypothetical protein C7256_22835 [Enterocloster lavalensis]RHR56006.1 hypothetical protein DWX10_04650 [Clostridium sp. AF18-27]
MQCKSGRRGWKQPGGRFTQILQKLYATMLSPKACFLYTPNCNSKKNIKQHPEMDGVRIHLEA